MWILSWLPNDALEFVIWVILATGLVSTLVSLVFINPLLRILPGIAGTYRLIQLASVAVFLVGVYLWGGFNTEMAWRERADKLEKEARAAEAKAEETNQKLDKAVTERDFAVQNTGKATENRIAAIVSDLSKDWKNNTPTSSSSTLTIDMSPEQRAQYEKELSELKKVIDQCPVPSLIIKEHNLNIKEQQQNRGWKGEFK